MNLWCEGVPDTISIQCELEKLLQYVARIVHLQGRGADKFGAITEPKATFLGWREALPCSLSATLCFTIWCNIALREGSGVPCVDMP